METTTFQQRKDEVLALARGSALWFGMNLDKFVNAIDNLQEHPLTCKFLDAMKDRFEGERALAVEIRKHLKELDDRPIDEIIESMDLYPSLQVLLRK